MKNILIFTKLTVKEALSRKIFMFFSGVSVFILVLFAIIFLSTDLEQMLPLLSMSKAGNVNLVYELVKAIKLFIVTPLFGIGLFLSVFSVASFIPNMLEKGSIELLLSNPVSRAQIIWGKFFGGVLVVFFNLAFLIFGLWALIGLKFAVWEPSLLYSILTITFTFAVLYGLIILVGIITQSSILAMMLTYLIFLIISPVLNARDKLALLINNDFVNKIIDVLYYIFPKTSELADITVTTATGGTITDFQPVVTSFLFMILTLYISIIIFSKKDF